MRWGTDFATDSQRPDRLKGKGKIRATAGGYGQRTPQSIEKELADFGGEWAFLNYARVRFEDAVVFQVPQIPDSVYLELMHHLHHASKSVQKIVKGLPHPTDKQRQWLSSSDKSGDTPGGNFFQAWLLNPYMEAEKMASRLAEDGDLVDHWRYEFALDKAHLAMTRDRKRLYWFSILIPYTSLLRGTPCWSWITRWAKQNLRWGSESSVQCWWRDKSKSLLRTPSGYDRERETFPLFQSIALFLEWLELCIPEDSFRLALGHQYIGAVIENFPALPDCYIVALDDLLHHGVKSYPDLNLIPFLHAVVYRKKASGGRLPAPSYRRRPREFKHPQIH